MRSILETFRRHHQNSKKPLTHSYNGNVVIPLQIFVDNPRRTQAFSKADLEAKRKSGAVNTVAGIITILLVNATTLLFDEYDQKHASSTQDTPSMADTAQLTSFSDVESAPNPDSPIPAVRVAHLLENPELLSIGGKSFKQYMAEKNMSYEVSMFGPSIVGTVTQTDAKDGLAIRLAPITHLKSFLFNDSNSPYNKPWSKQADTVRYHTFVKTYDIDTDTEIEFGVYDEPQSPHGFAFQATRRRVGSNENVFVIFPALAGKPGRTTP